MEVFLVRKRMNLLLSQIARMNLSLSDFARVPGPRSLVPALSLSLIQA